MGQDPGEIRQEIEATRGRMEDTVDAIGYKTDVSARAKDKLSSQKDRVMDRISDAKDRAVGSIVGTKDSVKERVESAGERVGDATPDGSDLKRGARQTAGMAQENPMGLVIGSFAFGFLAGMLLPSSSMEREKLGPVARDVKEKAKETGREAIDRGKQVIEQMPQAADEARQAVGEKVAERAKEQASELADSTKQRAQDISSQQS
jgi:gas vesicle protein